MAAVNVQLVKIVKKINHGFYRIALGLFAGATRLPVCWAGLPWKWPQRSSVALEGAMLGMPPLLQESLMELVYFSAIKTTPSPLSLKLIGKNTLLIEEVGLHNFEISSRVFLGEGEGRPAECVVLLSPHIPFLLSEHYKKRCAAF